MIRFFVVSFTVVILNAALSDKASVCVCVCVCVCGGGGGGGWKTSSEIEVCGPYSMHAALWYVAVVTAWSIGLQNHSKAYDSLQSMKKSSVLPNELL